MKKIITYALIAIGIYTLVMFVFSMLFSRSGQTMYGGATPIAEYKMMDNATAVPAAMSAEKPAPTQSEQVMRRMIIRNAQLSLQVNDIPKVMDAIIQLADNSGGYVVSSTFNQDTVYGGGSSAEVKIRVPAKGLNSALQRLKGLATKVIQESISGEDITQQYVNLESELKNLKDTKLQLGKIMQGATKTPDVLSVFEELSETQRKIDVTEGQIKYFKESVAFSLITIDISMNPDIKINQDSQWKIAQVFSESYKQLINYLREFTYGVIEFSVYLLPLILLWGIILCVVIWIAKSIYFRFK
ncbi:DUF4349 domain-containing protein [Legionella waltersii]|nr:DUF4349 domain-containing protein [Legionella waltersii]